jgi:hypothetical protein
MKLRLFACTFILLFGIEGTLVQAQIFKLDSEKETHPFNKFDNVNDIDSIKIYFLIKGRLTKKLPKS